MTVDAFKEFAEQRGWTYREEWMPAGEYEDPDTGEVETWDAYMHKTITRHEALGDCFVYQECGVSEAMLGSGESVWQLLIDVGNAEFEQRLEREKATLA